MVDFRRLVVTGDAGRAASVAQELRAVDWQILHGWRPPLVLGWSLAHERIACLGEIRERADAADAVVMAARGAGVIALVRCDSSTLALLVDDLRQLDEPELDTSLAGGEPLPHLDADQLGILRMIAAGATVTEAAEALHLSRRTAARRLADARRQLGVSTTVEAVARLHDGADVIDLGEVRRTNDLEVQP